MNWTTWLKSGFRHSLLVSSGLLMAMSASATLAPNGTTATAADYESSPPQVVEGADPLLLINLSVELTQQAEAFTDGTQTYANGTVCSNRQGGVWNPMLSQANWTVGVCYSKQERYIGYFDPNKCYVYDDTDANTRRVQRNDGPYGPNGASGFDAHHFVPDGATNSDYECNLSAGVSNQFSGNFLNWATMTALDEFRSAMTGGARIYDGTDKTILARTLRYDDWGFVPKVIDSSGIGGFTNDPSKLTPFGVTRLWIVNRWWHGGYSGSSGHRVRFFDGSGNPLYISSTVSSTGTDAPYNVFVQVCDASAGLETNCVAYTDGVTTWYKPEGLLQKNALKMRYALTSYTGVDGNGRNGGVLRSNAKYIGEFAPTTSGGYLANSVAEIDSNGLYVFDPEGVSGGSIVNSGILNYINMFGLTTNQYKSNDPVAELYYEGLRYLMGLNPTPSFSSGVTSTADMDGFPIYNGNVGSGSTFAWVDPITTTNSCQANFALYVGDQFAHEDNYLPGTGTATNCTTECADFEYMAGTPVPSLTLMEAETWTNTVGGLEGEGNIGNASRPTSGRGDGFWIAGLAYWARITDLRPSITGDQTVKTFVVDTQEWAASPPDRQENQLWLAAKYGGFDDINGDNDPNDGVPGNKDTANAEWTTDTSANPDPDAYTLASQPANLVAGLTNVFNNVLQSSSSASAAAVVSNSAQGIGALYEAIYEPRYTNNNVVTTWSGMVRGLFLDDQGRVREDTNGNATLDSTDKVVNYIKDNVTGEVTVDLADTGGTVAPGDSGISVRDLKTIWNARDMLAEMTNPVGNGGYGGQVLTNRSWPATANSVGSPHPLAETGRYIFTWLDTPDAFGVLNGAVDSGEVVDFEAAEMSTFGTGTYDTARLLGLDSTSGATSADVIALAEDLVDYIRGEDKAALGWRNRTVDYDGDGTDEVLRLGDVVHSAPLVVGPPEQRYDRDFSDFTYGTYKADYSNRRQVIYVGGNDGMLHAFNGGFFDAANKQFDLTGGNNEASHALGAELWAYVPFNLLPHLQWLKDPSYSHVYYVDGSPQAFDVNIFTPSSTHPEGWGTILVVGFRLGGGDIKVDYDSDHDGTNEITMRSAYVILDITDPEQPPTLLAEITDLNLGFTTSNPVVVKRRVANAGSYSGLSDADDRWYLVFGSGPAGTTAAAKGNALTAGTSNQEARVYFYDLNDLQMETGSPFLTGQADGFVGGLSTKDWNKDYTDDNIYFGTVATVTSGTPATTTPSGSLFRLTMATGSSFSSPTIVDMFSPSVDQPFSAPPYATRDSYGQPWVYAGSGRFLVDADIILSHQNSYYGLKETLASGGVNASATISKSADLEDTTGVEIFTDFSVTPNGSISANTWAGLLTEVRLARGWYFDFSSPFARHVDRTLQVQSSVIFTDYVTTGNSCSPLGSSNLYAINMLTGTSSPFKPLGTDPNNTLLANTSVDLGTGQAFLSGITTVGGAPMVRYSTSLTENSGQSIALPTTTGSRMSWRELPIK